MTGTVFLGASEYSVLEGEPYVSVTFQRIGDTSGAVKIAYATTGNSAVEGVDYTGVNTTAIIPVGADSVTVKIPIKDDSISESTETFGVSIVSIDSGTLLYPRTANVSILDDETPALAAAEPPLTSPYTVTTKNVVTGLHQPMNIEWLPGSGSTALVSEKGGVIKVVDMSTGATKSVLLDISKEVNSSGDRGLMDVALHPDFAHNPYLYAYYVVDPPDSSTASGLAAQDGGGNRYAYVVRYKVDTSGSTLKIVDGSKKILVGGAGQSLSDISGNGALDFTDATYRTARASNVDPATGHYKEDYIKVDSSSHAGGALAFGPDGALYVGIGDGTSFNYTDPRTAGVQDVTSLSGKILRIDPMTGDGLADNPFADASDLSANESKVWQLGLRNPYAMTFADDGRLFISETGWYSHEEINTGDAGANFGWPYYEGDEGGTLIKTPSYQGQPGASSFYSQVASGAISITAAYQSFSHLSADPGYQVSAIVGASSIYTGDKYPSALQNDYFFTDIVHGEIYSIDINDRTQTQFLTDLGDYGPVGFFQGPDGYMYFTDLLNGRIGRFNISDPSATEKLYSNTAKDQTITGSTTNDIFVVGAASTGYQIAPTKDGTGIVVFKGDSYDILFGFEKIRFTDTSVDLSSMNGPFYHDDPEVVQHLVGNSSSDTFVIAGKSSDYDWSRTKDGTGVVVWTVSKADDTYDVLDHFETILFSDIALDLKSVGVSVKGSSKSDRIDLKHAPKGQSNPTDANDTINGRGGNDKVKSFDGNDVVIGAKGNDKLKGLDGDDSIFGGKGKDKLWGGDGSDLLSGGAGVNKLVGGTGADSFKFDAGLSKSFNKVMDFDSAEGDKVLLAKSIFDDKLLKDGDLSATDFDKLFNYKNDGVLKYDGEKVAKFMGHPDLHFDDFWIV